MYLALFVSCYIFSNQYIDSNSRYVLPAFIACITYYADKRKINSTLLNILFIFSIFTACIYSLNYETKTSFIYNCNKTLDVKTMYGINIEDEVYDKYFRTKSLFTNYENITIVSKKLNLSFYLQNWKNKNICDPLNFNNQYNYTFVDYFNYNNINKVSIIVEKEKYKNEDSFYEGCEFGEFISKQWKHNITSENEYCFIIDADRN